MKRFPFMAALFGLTQIAKPQVETEIVCYGAMVAGNGKLVRRCVPGPNECPICGTAAPPFKRPLGVVGTFGDGTLLERPYGPSENLTRCKYCSAAFYQDEAK